MNNKSISTRMKNTLNLTFFGLILCLLMACQNENPPQKHIVFVTGDEEYRSEESMPMLARILKREGFRVSICYALDSAGFIDPNNIKHISGLEILDSADMMVLFTRFRALPENERNHIIKFSESGKPMVGFRTATHAFKYKEDSTLFQYNDDWPRKIFGQKWITHHGHFGDGHEFLTDVQIIPGKEDNVVLRGVKPFKAYSWLYHVHGGDHELFGNCDTLLRGRALKSNHLNNLEKFQIENPVAWTKTYNGEFERGLDSPLGVGGKSGDSPSGARGENGSRVFFSTVAHPFDFKDESCRKLALNGIMWALGEEDRIPKDGRNADYVGEYEPNNSGFGKKYKLNRKPPEL